MNLSICHSKRSEESPIISRGNSAWSNSQRSLAPLKMTVLAKIENALHSSASGANRKLKTNKGGNHGNTNRIGGMGRHSQRGQGINETRQRRIRWALFIFIPL